MTPTDAAAPDAAATEPERDWLDKVLSSPITGFVPWIVLSVLEGPGRIAMACGVAFALSATVIVLERIRGASMKILSCVDVVAFGAFLVGSLVASPGTTNWLETWFGEIANIILVLIVVISMAFRQPFTLQYAKDQTPEEYWDTPTFLRVNYTITGVWGLAFLAESIAGFVGDAILHSDNDIWTGWIIQIFASMVAVAFTAWYPDYATAKSLEEAGQPTDPPPPVWNFWGDVASYVIGCGVASLVFDGGPWYLGVGLIVAGGVSRGFCQRQAAAAPGTAAPDGALDTSV